MDHAMGKLPMGASSRRFHALQSKRVSQQLSSNLGLQSASIADAFPLFKNSAASFTTCEMKKMFDLYLLGLR
jgi:hypothetical protein